ncbi:hypothetical protein BN988_02827 [Oceanobacillus picturae]|uniref:Uncharacterized protein n=1 Tax=Oceanobacillus picturae TaxID=171693 RepID=W9AFL8_9BACI|nr:hypothetical protein [Oceanobacillus picturae]CDO04273.1 hypothetical protein BN988_02827 [Oceanobacillus picturae]
MVNNSKKKLQFKGISFSLFGVQVGWELTSKNVLKADDKIDDDVGLFEEHKFRDKIRNCLKELYILRNNLSNFYWTFNNLEQLLSAKYNDEENLEFHFINECYIRALEVYNNIAGILMGSEYFLFVKNEERKQILESFDYVMLQQILIEHDDEYEIPVDEQREIVEDLISIYRNIDNQIDYFSSMLLEGDNVTAQSLKL